MNNDFRILTSGLGAVFGIGGLALLILGVSISYSPAISSGHTLIGLSIALWVISLASNFLNKRKNQNDRSS